MRPLGPSSRKTVIFVELYSRRHGRSPTWREVRVALGFDPVKAARLLEGLEHKGLIAYTHEARSLRVTSAGLRQALGRVGPS